MTHKPDDEASRRMRILAIDIETQPNLAYTWGIWDQNIGLSQLVEAGQMMCFVAKWVGKPKIEFRSVHHDGQQKMILRAWHLLDEADVVMHYNGKRFDVPWLQREFIRLNLDPPSPFKQIDLLQVARREFKFPSNKLAYVSEALGLDGKVEHQGFDLWVKCMAGDRSAWKLMREYNVRDVTLLEELYEKLRPWIRGHPSHGAFSGADVCPACGSAKLVHRGFAFLRTGRYQRYQCGECSRWSRSTRSAEGSRTTITEVPNS